MTNHRLCCCDEKCGPAAFILIGPDGSFSIGQSDPFTSCEGMTVEECNADCYPSWAVDHEWYSDYTNHFENLYGEESSFCAINEDVIHPKVKASDYFIDNEFVDADGMVRVGYEAFLHPMMKFYSSCQVATNQCTAEDVLPGGRCYPWGVEGEIHLGSGLQGPAPCWPGPKACPWNDPQQWEEPPVGGATWHCPVASTYPTCGYQAVLSPATQCPGPTPCSVDNCDANSPGGWPHPLWAEPCEFWNCGIRGNEIPYGCPYDNTKCPDQPECDLCEISECDYCPEAIFNYGWPEHCDKENYCTADNPCEGHGECCHATQAGHGGPDGWGYCEECDGCRDNDCNPEGDGSHAPSVPGCYQTGNGIDCGKEDGPCPGGCTTLPIPECDPYGGRGQDVNIPCGPDAGEACGGACPDGCSCCETPDQGHICMVQCQSGGTPCQQPCAGAGAGHPGGHKSDDCPCDHPDCDPEATCCCADAFGLYHCQECPCEMEDCQEYFPISGQAPIGFCWPRCYKNVITPGHSQGLNGPNLSFERPGCNSPDVIFQPISYPESYKECSMHLCPPGQPGGSNHPEVGFYEGRPTLGDCPPEPPQCMDLPFDKYDFTFDDQCVGDVGEWHPNAGGQPDAWTYSHEPPCLKIHPYSCYQHPKEISQCPYTSAGPQWPPNWGDLYQGQPHSISLRDMVEQVVDQIITRFGPPVFPTGRVNPYPEQIWFGGSGDSRWEHARVVYEFVEVYNERYGPEITDHFMNPCSNGPSCACEWCNGGRCDAWCGAGSCPNDVNDWPCDMPIPPDSGPDCTPCCAHDWQSHIISFTPCRCGGPGIPGEQFPCGWCWDDQIPSGICSDNSHVEDGHWWYNVTSATMGPGGDSYMSNLLGMMNSWFNQKHCDCALEEKYGRTCTGFNVALCGDPCNLPSPEDMSKDPYLCSAAGCSCCSNLHERPYCSWWPGPPSYDTTDCP